MALENDADEILLSASMRRGKGLTSYGELFKANVFLKKTLIVRVIELMEYLSKDRGFSL